MIARFASALRRAGGIAVERPRAALWTTLALTCALVAVAIAGVTATSLEDTTAVRPGSSASMIVYLAPKTTDARAAELVTELRALQGVDHVELVSPAESARRLVAALEHDTALLDGVDVAALPASIEVTLAPGVRDVIAMSPTMHALKGSPGVAEVVVEDPGEDRISGALAAGRAIAWAAAALFAGLALITVIATSRVALDRGSRRDWKLVELLGGGPGFVVVPTAIAGALHGIVAAVLAVAVVALGLYAWADSISETLASSLGHVELGMPGAVLVAAFVGGGAMLGLVGGTLAGASRVAR